MFGIFKKKKEAPAPNPETAKMAERINEQTEIAELQSRISELRRQSSQMNAEIARKQEERAALMAKIQAAPPAQKTALALRVKNIDKYVAGLNGNLALIEQQIGNIESTLLQKDATVVVDAGDVSAVVENVVMSIDMTYNTSTPAPPQKYTISIGDNTFSAVAVKASSMNIDHNFSGALTATVRD